MKVLFAASEAEPFIKTGGLADVSYALPKYLKKQGLDVRIVIPKYRDIKNLDKYKPRFITRYIVPVGWRNQYCGVFECDVDGLIYYLIDNEYYFFRDGLYGYYDDGEKFAFFDRAVLMMLKEVGFKPDIIHCNDWQTGMIPVLYKVQYQYDHLYHSIKTLFTIHNLAYQGNFDPHIVEELLGLNRMFYDNGSLEFYGAASFMKGGINFADEISTVSISYAKEIQTPMYGERMNGLLRWRAEHLHGILNGIDYNIYNPKTDPHIYRNYSIDTIEEKHVNKIKLQEELGLKVGEDIPLVGIVSRLTRQKGMDLIRRISGSLLQKGVEMVILGAGDWDYEDFFRYLQSAYSGRVSANIQFDDSLARRIYAASDLFLMPSLFEPCGLSQIIAMRYGSLPVVRETGGLKDTVKPYNRFTGEGNGFSFASFNGDDLFYVVTMALDYYNDKKTWEGIVRQAMSSDYSWDKSAREYISLYEKMLRNR